MHSITGSEMQQFNPNSPLNPGIRREIPVVHYPVVATNYGVPMYGPPPLASHVLVSEILPPVSQSNGNLNTTTSQFQCFNFHGQSDPLAIGRHTPNATSRPAPSPSTPSSTFVPPFKASPPPGFSWSLTQLEDKMDPTPRQPQVPFKEQGQNEKVSITKEQQVFVATGPEQNSADSESNSVNRKVLQLSSKIPSLSQDDSTSTITATTPDCSNASIAKAVAIKSPVHSMKQDESTSTPSSLALSRLNPEVKEFVPKLSMKRPRPSEDSQAEKLTQEKKEGSEKKSPCRVTSEEKKPEREQEPSKDVSGDSTNEREHELNSLAKLSKKAPFLFQLPPKPQWLKQRSASSTSKMTKDSETQTDSLTDQNGCAACGLRRTGETKVSASVIIKNVSRDHKIKYVAHQTSMMVRENPDCLVEEFNLQTRLKTKLQAMCRQFGSSVTDKSEVEDATICRIATDLLREQPVFHQEDKQVSFLRHISAEADVQLEIAFELMSESPVKDTTRKKETGQQFNVLGNSVAHNVASSTLKPSEISSSTNNVGVPSLDSSSSTKFLEESNLAGGSNNLLLNDKLGGCLPKASKTEPELESAKLNPRIAELSEAVKHESVLGKAEESPPLVTPNVPHVDLQRCQEAVQLLKWQQSYLQSMLGSLSLDGNSGSTWTAPVAPVNYQSSDELIHPSKGQVSASNVQQSSLTTENLVKHNSLINQEKTAHSCKPSGSDVSNNLVSDVGKNSYPVKSNARLGNLRKLPPLDLRGLKKTQAISSKPTSAQEAVNSSLPYSCKPKHAEIALSDSGSESQLSASSDTKFSTPAILNARQPNLSTVSTISQSRKFLTPLQRKRLKKMEESAKAGETQAQTPKPQHFGAETNTMDTDFLKDSSVAHTFVTEETPNPSKKRASPLSSEQISPSIKVNASSYLSSRLPSNPSSKLQSIFHHSSLEHFSQGFVSNPYTFSPAIPSTFCFPSCITKSNKEASFTNSASSLGLTHPILPFDTSKYNKIGQPSAALVHAKPSITPQNQTVPLKQYVSSSNFPNSSLSRSGFTASIKKEIPFEPPGLCPISASSNQQNMRGLSSLSQSTYKNLEDTFRHSLSAEEPTVAKNAIGDQINELNCVYPKMTDQVHEEFKTYDENDNYAFSSSVSDETSHNLDDLETLGNDDSESELKSKTDDSDIPRTKDNVPLIDWYAFDIQSTRTKPDTTESREYPVPCYNSEQHPSSAASSSNDGVSLNLDSLIKEKLKKVQATTCKGGYGLDEISLTDSKKKHTPAVAETESVEKTDVKPVILDDGWQTVGNPKKSSKKSRVLTDANLIKFQTQEKYTNLVNVILEQYKFLEREEAQEVLETVFTSTNQLAGLRQKQILAEVDMVVTEWYPERAKASVVKNGETSNEMSSSGDATYRDSRAEKEEQEMSTFASQEIDETN